MAQHWENVAKTFEALSYIVKEVDKNGLDLYFTISPIVKIGEKTTTDMVTIVRNHKRKDEAASDIGHKLTPLLEEYSRKLGEKRASWKSPIKPLSLYILTDGVWEENSSAAEAITNVIRVLEEKKKSSTQIGIQLISFGTNRANLAKLKHLDEGLELPMCV